MERSLAADADAYRRLLTDSRTGLQALFVDSLPAGSADLTTLLHDTLTCIHTKRATFDRAQTLDTWAYAIARHRLDALARRRPARSRI